MCPPQHDVGIDWYENRDLLQPGMIFKTYDGHVKLDRRTEGDGTKWGVLSWYEGRPEFKGYEHGRWSCEDAVVEPGDLLEQVTEASLIRPHLDTDTGLSP